MTEKIRARVWNEFRHEKNNPKVSGIYPQGMHEAIAEGLRGCDDIEVSTAWLDQSEHGLSEEALEVTDVLLWWGHMCHGEVSDEVVERVRRRVLEGMAHLPPTRGPAHHPQRRPLGKTDRKNSGPVPVFPGN